MTNLDNETSSLNVEEQDELHVNGKKKQKDYINRNKNGDQQQNKYSEFELAINVSDALRLHSGLVKVQGMISSLYPPYKMVSATGMECTNCTYSDTISYEKPESVPRTMSKKCPSCVESTVSFSHVYVNAVNVELQDTESFSEIERLPVLLFDENTRNIRAGERVTIIGKVHIIQSGKKGKSFSFLYADSIEYSIKRILQLPNRIKTQ
jgi:MCM OB domain